MTYYYETGVEIPEILGSGSQKTYVFGTSDRRAAMEAYKRCGRNYLTRRYLKNGRLTFETYDPERKKWKR